MDLAAVCIVTDAAKDDVNRVWETMGRGPGTFSIPLNDNETDALPENYETPATHFLMADSSAQDTDVAEWQAMQHGDLPSLPPGVVWGENGVISAADAMAAVSGANLQVYSASGDISPVDHVAGILLGRGLFRKQYPL